MASTGRAGKQRDGQGSDSGLRQLRQSSALRGPVDPPDEHEHTNDHLALVYEDRDEQFAAAVPFIRQGLERGEQCLYVADDNSRAEVLEAMRVRGIDVEEAVASGALTVRTAADTYRRDGEFDRDAMLQFWQDALETAHGDDYEGLRAAAEMTWALDGETDPDLLVEYEALLNDLYQDEDYVVLCQYNRRRFPADVVHDVLRTHPHFVHQGVIHQNAYYMPPEEFFAPDDFEQEVERMLSSMHERAAAKMQLQERERYLRRLYGIAADAERSFEEKVRAVLDLGCELFDLDLGGVARIDPGADQFEVKSVNADHEYIRPGAELALSETYCRVHADGDGGVVGIEDPDESFRGTIAHDEFDVRSYLGTRISVDGEPDRTLFFVSEESRETGFTDGERTFNDLMGQWLGYELERRRHERELEGTIEELEQSNERLQQFAYAASHDLQEPLRMVSSYLRLVERRYGGELDEDGREFLEFATEGADRMRDMIDSLLEYSRVESRGSPPEPVDLGDVMADVRTDMQVQLSEADAEVVVEPLPRVVGDADQLRQVFQNLLDNAIEYSGDEPPHVRVSAERAGPQWEISVCDAGVGIDPNDFDRIFEVFQRLHAFDEHPGTGIGLALCERIVERHGGDIWVDSEPGEGTTFAFTLPAVDGDGATDEWT